MEDYEKLSNLLKTNFKYGIFIFLYFYKILQHLKQNDKQQVVV